MKKGTEHFNVQNRKIRDWFLAKYEARVISIREKGEIMPVFARAKYYEKEAKKIYDNKPIYDVLWRHAIETYLQTGHLVIPQSDAFCSMSNTNEIVIKIGKHTKLKDIDLIWKDVEIFQRLLSEKPVIGNLDPAAIEIYKEKIKNPKKTYEEIVAAPKFKNYTSGHAKQLKSEVEKVLKLL